MYVFTRTHTLHTHLFNLTSTHTYIHTHTHIHTQIEETTPIFSDRGLIVGQLHINITPLPYEKKQRTMAIDDVLKDIDMGDVKTDSDDEDSDDDLDFMVCVCMYVCV